MPRSSLLNALVGTDRAIVSEIPGTTRDTIEERIVIDGVPVVLVDTAGIRANAGPTAYSASKAGVISLVQDVANELYGTGVRVNAICPGLIETGMTKPIFERAHERGTQDKIGQLNPLQRAGAPEEIAAMALFLASDESSYVNGHAFPVDGGLASTLPFTRPIR